MPHRPHRSVLLALSLIAAATATACVTDEDDAYSLTLDVTLTETDGEMRFVTPVGAVEKYSTANVVGKPYFVAAFPAGVSPKTGDAFESAWGVVPANLEMSFTTAPVFEDGPYDMVFVVYVNTAITSEMTVPGVVPPAVIAGDLATFTIDVAAAHPGEPAIVPGVVRLNVEGGDQRLAVENRVPDDPGDPIQTAAALTNTVMLVP